MTRWRVVVGGVLMNLALGSLYAWSIFVAPLEKEFHWRRAETSLTYTIAVFTFAITFVIAGRLQDKYGPRLCSILGALFVSAGFFLASFTTSLTFVYLAFGFVVGIGNGFGYATPIPVASKWFPDKRGLVVGIMVGGYGAASFVLGLFVPGLIASLGWRTTFQVLGGVFLVMGLIGATLIRNPPAGYTAPAPSRARAIPRVEFTAGEMLRTRQFYLLWIAYCLGTTAGQMTISQLVPFAVSAGATAATALLVGACGNASGRILSGWMSDVAGRLTTLRLMVLLSALAMPALWAFREERAVFYVLIALVYWCYGTQLSVFASTIADFYGTANLGLNYGALFTAWGVAGILGPMIAGRVFDVFGAYRYAFYAASALALISLVALSLTRQDVRVSHSGAAV